MSIGDQQKRQHQTIRNIQFRTHTVANVPTKAEATPAAIVINDLTSAFWRYDHGRNSVVLFTVMRFSIGGDMTW